MSSNAPRGSKGSKGPRGSDVGKSAEDKRGSSSKESKPRKEDKPTAAPSTSTTRANSNKMPVPQDPEQLKKRLEALKKDQETLMRILRGYDESQANRMLNEAKCAIIYHTKMLEMAGVVKKNAEKMLKPDYDRWTVPSEVDDAMKFEKAMQNFKIENMEDQRHVKEALKTRREAKLEAYTYLGNNDVFKSIEDYKHKRALIAALKKELAAVQRT